MDNLTKLIDNLYKFLTDNDKFSEKCNLIKKHSDNLNLQGDFNYSIKIHFWQKFLKSKKIEENIDNILNLRSPGKSKEEVLEDLVTESQKWELQITKTVLVDDRCLIFLERSKTIKFLLHSILTNEDSVGKQSKSEEHTISLQLQQNEIKTITELRAELVYNVTKNLIEYSQYSLSDTDESAHHKLLITTKSNFSKTETDLIGKKKILCGVVLDSKIGSKVAEISAAEYTK